MATGSKAATLAPRSWQPVDQRDRRRIAHVVGIGLEGESEDRDLLALQTCRRAPRSTRSAIACLALVVDRDRGADDALVDPGRLGGLEQRQRVLGKAAPAIAGTGVEEFGADAVVEADSARDILDVGVDRLAQIGDFVDEADLDREEGIGGIFGQLGGAPAGEQDRRLVEEQRPVDLVQHLAGVLVLGADDDPVGDA